MSLLSRIKAVFAGGRSSPPPTHGTTTAASTPRATTVAQPGASAITRPAHRPGRPPTGSRSPVIRPGGPGYGARDPGRLRDSDPGSVRRAARPSPAGSRPDRAGRRRHRPAAASAAGHRPGRRSRHRAAGRPAARTPGRAPPSTGSADGTRDRHRPAEQARRRGQVAGRDRRPDRPSCGPPARRRVNGGTTTTSNPSRAPSAARAAGVPRRS